MSRKVLGNTQKGQLFVISAPAGTGKSTLVEMVLEEFSDAVAESCSCTTRPPRPGEVDREHYAFLSVAQFEAKIAAGEFIEWAKVFGHYYGTRTEEVTRLLRKGKHVVLVIDTQGALQVMDQMEATFVFISPPSMEELRRRLFKRRTESEELIEERLRWAQKEMEVAPRYDYHIVNDDLAITYQVLRSILIAEEHKI